MLFTPFDKKCTISAEVAQSWLDVGQRMAELQQLCAISWPHSAKVQRMWRNVALIWSDLDAKVTLSLKSETGFRCPGRQRSNGGILVSFGGRACGG